MNLVFHISEDGSEIVCEVYVYYNIESPESYSHFPTQTLTT